MPEQQLALIDLARAALAEVAPHDQIGEHLNTSEADEAGVRTLRFAAAVPGHRDWIWTVWTVQLADAEPTVLECDLLPGEDALLAPAWVPWVERLAEFRATHDRHGNPLADDDDTDGEPDTQDERADGTRDRVSRRTVTGGITQRTTRRTRRRRRRVISEGNDEPGSVTVPETD